MKRAVVLRGGAVRCHVDFNVKKNIHLRSITARISAKERKAVTFTGEYGPDEQTKTVVDRIYTKTYNEDLSTERRIVFECVLPVNLDDPASFLSKKNCVEWFVTMRADIKGWSEWQMTFPITVLPGVSRDEKELSVMLDEIRPAKRS